MSVSTVVEAVSAKLGDTFPSILGAVAVLLIGWLIAVLLRAATRRGLALLRANSRVESLTGSSIDVQSGAAIGVYYFVLLFVLIGFFNVLELGQVASPLQTLADRVLTFLPNLIAAGVLALLAWIAAVVIRKIVTTGLGKTTLDERVSAEAGMRPVSDSIGQVAYWLVLLFFLPAVLETLGLFGLLEPVNAVLGKVMAILPNLAAAAALGFAGWLVARIVRDLTTNLLRVAGLDRLGERAGLRGETTLSGLVGLVAYIFVLVPAIIAALQAMQLEAISGPATSMLETLMSAVPSLFGAALVLGIGILLAQVVATLVSGLLGGMGFDLLPEKLGLAAAVAESPAPSQLAGHVARFFVIVFSAVEAGSMLGFRQLSGHLSTFIAFAGQVLLGMAIIAIGLWIARLAFEAMLRVGAANGRFWASVVRYAILALVVAMGLKSMGIGEEIVTRAFTITLGAIGVAGALAFGLGGRDAAGRQMDAWISRMEDGPVADR